MIVSHTRRIRLADDEGHLHVQAVLEHRRKHDVAFDQPQ
jgi:hypothetical protein